MYVFINFVSYLAITNALTQQQVCIIISKAFQCLFYPITFSVESDYHLSNPCHGVCCTMRS